MKVRELDNTVSILLSGEDSGLFVDYDLSLSSSYSDNDKIYRLQKGENESDTEFSDCEEKVNAN